MNDVVNYSEQSLNAAIQGNFNQLALKIERQKGITKYTLMTREELGKIGKIARLTNWIFSQMTRNLVSAWGTPQEVEAFCHRIIQNRLKANPKTQQILRKFLNLAQNGCLLDRRYEMEIPCFHPEYQSLSFYHKDLMNDYEKQCRDSSLDLISWYKTEEGQIALEKHTGMRDIDAFRIQYFTEKERDAFVVAFQKISEKTVLLSQGKPLQTLSAEEKTPENTLSMFVLGHDEKLYVTSHKPGQVQHSSFFMGLPVISAGEIITNTDGELLYLSNRSGHYKPNKQSMLYLLRILHKNGVDLAKITLLIHAPVNKQNERGRFNALQYLKSLGTCESISNGIIIQLEDGSKQLDTLMQT